MPSSSAREIPQERSFYCCSNQTFRHQTSTFAEKGPTSRSLKGDHEGEQVLPPSTSPMHSVMSLMKGSMYAMGTHPVASWEVTYPVTVVTDPVGMSRSIANPRPDFKLQASLIISRSIVRQLPFIHGDAGISAGSLLFHYRHTARETESWPVMYHEREVCTGRSRTK